MDFMGIKEKPAIPLYEEINDFLESIPSDHRTSDPDFYCLRLKPNEGTVNHYKPPFRKKFYFIALVSDAQDTRIGYDHTSETDLNAFLVFQAPGLIYSFQRGPSATGYLVYFKRECLSFFRPDIESEFPFFDITHTNFYRINRNRFEAFAPQFEEMFRAYAAASDPQHRVASAKLLALMYELREFTQAFSQWEEGFSSPQQLLLKKFIQLVNSYYIEKRTIEEYATLLHVTPNHLSQSVKAASGRNALSYITGRLIAEARSLIRHTDFDIAEIAYQLNFSDPANFGKFFRKHTGLTPLQYRRQPG